MTALIGNRIGSKAGIELTLDEACDAVENAYENDEDVNPLLATAFQPNAHDCGMAKVAAR